MRSWAARVVRRRRSAGGSAMKRTYLTRVASAALIAFGGCSQQAPVNAPANVAAANVAPALPAAPPQQTAQASPETFSADQLESMLAPIALYPDELLTQILMAATFPLEIVTAHRWLGEGDNRTLKGPALETALREQTWDPSVKSLTPFPQVLESMNKHLQWTQQVGYAMQVQPDDVFNAIQ